MRDALRESHGDEKKYHADAIARLSAESTKLQQRIEAMYEDKLDGKVDAAYFERKSADWRGDQSRLLQQIQEHQTANQSYLSAGVQLLELANKSPCVPLR